MCLLQNGDLARLLLDSVFKQFACNVKSNTSVLVVSKYVFDFLPV